MPDIDGPCEYPSCVDPADWDDNGHGTHVAGIVAAARNGLGVSGDLNPDGTPNTEAVVRDCQGGTCAYYQYLQGTSMASPHAAGAGALIVSEYGGATPATAA